MEKDWKILIILDACRYDYFEKTYRDYLDGNLKKVESAGSHTSEWLKRTWDGNFYEDIIYINSNPVVLRTDGFNPDEKFFKVINLLGDNYWNEELDTVLPSTVSKQTRMARAKYPRKRIVSHFIQPHAPYLDIGSLSGRLKKGYREDGNEDPSFTNTVRSMLGSIGVALLGKLEFRKIRRRLGLAVEDDVELAEKMYGDEKLREFYENNIKEVLKEVSKLVGRLPDKNIVVTTDHGELLGEEGYYSHFVKAEHRLLRTVPWLEVDKNG